MNVRGLRNTNKRRAIFSYLKDQIATIFNLQETFSKPEDEKIWTAEWGGNGFFSHGTEHSKGVTMLTNPASKSQVSIVEIDPQSVQSLMWLMYMHQMITANRNNLSES